MPKKVKRTLQKQKQLQQVIVNVGDVKRKRVRRKRQTRRRGVSDAAKEYAQAISQIIPRIQYNMPYHTNFNYDNNITSNASNITQPTKPNDVTHSIPIMVDKPKHETQNIIQEKDKGFPKSQFTEPKPQPDLLPLKKPEPDALSNKIPIDIKDKDVSLVEGLTDQIIHEKKDLAKRARLPKPKKKTIDKMLNERGLPDTEENRNKMIGDWEHSRTHLTAFQIRQQRLKEEEENTQLEEMGLVTKLSKRPEEIKKKLVKPKINLKKKEVNLYMDKPKESTVPIMETEVQSSL
jgi:hypothetical protein